MIIKLVKVKDIEHAGYPFKEIIGKKADGSDYSKRIIVGNQTADLLNTLDNFGTGDYIELSYDKSKFRNISGIKEASGFPEEPKPTPATQKYGSPSVTGNSRGEDYNRSSAIYLAREVINMTNTEAALRKMNYMEFLSQLTFVADKIKDYITNGNIIYSDKNEAVEDVLDPPEV